MAEIKRTYTIPLRRKYANTPRYKRTHKAVRVLREYLAKHMKSEDIKIGKFLNDHLWINGIKNPPSKVTVTAIKDDNGVVRTELEGKKYVDFKIQEKVDNDQSFKEKLQSKVAGAKGEATTEKTPVKDDSAPKESSPKTSKAPTKDDSATDTTSKATKPASSANTTEDSKKSPEVKPKTDDATSSKN